MENPLVRFQRGEPTERAMKQLESLLEMKVEMSFTKFIYLKNKQAPFQSHICERHFTVKLWHYSFQDSPPLLQFIQNFAVSLLVIFWRDDLVLLFHLLKCIGQMHTTFVKACPLFILLFMLHNKLTLVMNSAGLYLRNTVVPTDHRFVLT